MPKKRRQAHIPQGAPRKRRPARRPDFEPAPEPKTDQDGQPIFADPPVYPDAFSPYGTTGPVETRPHWIGSTDAGRTPGRRRLEQLRRSAGETVPTGRVATGQLPLYDRSYLIGELRRIGITSTVLLGVIIVLALVLR
jgi:hypothetical protein